MRKIRIIAAVDKEGGFGKDGKIPWNIPEDLKHFQTTTKDSVCVMGKNTYDDMLEMMKDRGREDIDHILPGRISYVMSSSTTEFEGATHTQSISSVADAHPDKEVFVIGGERMFIEALSWAYKINLTVIDDIFDCDRFFPIQVLEKWFTITDGSKMTTDDDTEVFFTEYTRNA